jgi:GT2 family glycosyltransferase
LIRAANRYVGAARNLAARHASGEYLLFMDDDNIARSDEIETFVRAAQHSDADVLTTVSDVFSGDSPRDDTSPSEHYWLPLGDCAALGVFQNCFGDANALIRRSAFERLGGFTEDYGVGHEDWELFATATLAGVRMFVLPEPLFWYRVAEQGMLISGNRISNHARSIRPYLSEGGGYLGSALALALRMSLTPVTSSRSSGNLAGLGGWRSLARVLYTVAGDALTSPTLRAKFRRTLSQRGPYETLQAVLSYMQRVA